MAKGKQGNGEGSITQRKDGLWRASMTVGWNGTKQIRKDLYAKTRREVADKMDALKESLRKGTYNPGRKPTLEQFLTRWLEHKKVGPTTLVAYRQKIELHVVPTLGRIRIDQLTVQHVNDLLDAKAKTLSAQSVKHIRAVLRDALNDAIRWGDIGRNVAELADPPRVEQYEAMALSLDQARAFMAAADSDRLAALYRVAVPLGLRQGEALGLRWEDIDLDGRMLHVRRSLKRLKGQGLVNLDTKTRQSRRDLPLHEVGIRALRAHKARQLEERLLARERWVDSGLVFTTMEGRPLSATHVVNGSFRRICEAASIPFSTSKERGLRFHDLRHSAATLLMAMGVQPRVVMEILGHTSIATTTRYQHVPSELMREAMGRMDIALSESNEGALSG